MFSLSALALLALPCLISGSPALGWSSTSASPSPTPSSSLPPCPAAVNGLISGIEINILAQHGELNATLALQATSPYNPTTIVAGKAVLVNVIMFGMTIREYNQLITPPGNAVIPGLAKYAAAEEVELGLAQSLNGDPAHDVPVLAMLVSDVTTGIQLNMNNTLLAATGCCSPLLQYLPIVVADEV